MIDIKEKSKNQECKEDRSSTYFLFVKASRTVNWCTVNHFVA